MNICSYQKISIEVEVEKRSYKTWKSYLWDYLTGFLKQTKNMANYMVEKKEKKYSWELAYAP